MSTRSKNTMMLMYSGRGRRKSEEGVALDNAEEDDGDKREMMWWMKPRHCRVSSVENAATAFLFDSPLNMLTAYFFYTHTTNMSFST